MVNVHKNNHNVPVSPVRPADPQSHMRGPGPLMVGRLPGQLDPQQSPQPLQPLNGMGIAMLPPGQAGMNGPPHPSGKDGEGDVNLGLRTPGSLISGALPMNPQRPTTASAPVPTPPPPAQVVSTPDLPFYMSEMITNAGRDFLFPGSLGNGTLI